MNRYTIQIDAAGAAFDDDEHLEVARILEKIARKFRAYQAGDHNLLDVNGNRCGQLVIDEVRDWEV